MMRFSGIWFVRSVLLLVALALTSGCGGDDGEGSATCDADAGTGAPMACQCDDGSSGTQLCQADGTLSDCACGSNADPGNTNTGGSGLDSGTPSTGNTNPGDMTAADSDAGSDTAPGATDGGGQATDTTAPATGAPQDGTQLAFCEASADCNDGLSCYTFGNYCSAECSVDEDCAALGASYTCYVLAGPGGGGFPGGGPGGGTTTGVCRAECSGADDTSCADLMECANVGFGGTESWRCVYTEAAAPQPDPGTGGGGGGAAAFEQCSTSDDCASGLSCNAFGGGVGYCTQACAADDECTEQPSNGSVTPNCGFAGTCSLNCADATDGCPGGMECISFGGGGGGFAFCNYP
ncbi:MAG: hypothetical protein OEZ06_27945 [Myxococcales bacterium]|nr:hypothetical protein [Myxococcales bacterium]